MTSMQKILGGHSLQSIWENTKWRNKVNVIVFISATIIMTVLSLTIPRFFTLGNTINLFVQISTTGLLAIGMTFVLVTGGIDLSIASVMSLSACVGAAAMINTGSVLLGCLVMLLVSTTFGFINGVAIAKAKMLPFIVTLSTMSIASGLVIWFTDGQTISNLPRSFTSTVGGFIGIFPIAAVSVVVIAIIASIILKKTMFGRCLYACGHNEDTAKVSGVPVDWVKISAYMISGFMGGVTAILLTARLSVAAASMVSDTTLMDVIVAAVIGGASLKGGLGSIPGTIGGALFIAILTNSMNLLNVSFYYSMLLKGLVIVVVIAVDRVRTSTL